MVENQFLAAHFRHTFEAILNPFFISFILLTLSIFWLWRHGDGRVARSGLLLSLLGFFLFSTGWLPHGMTHMLEGQYPIVMNADPTIRWIVVLGGGHYKDYREVPDNDELSSVSLERLVEGVRLYRQIPHAKLLLSGGIGNVGGTTAEAQQLATVASWFNIPRSAMVLETSSYNTVDEAVAIKEIIHDAPFYLVTSAIHMPRAMALCQSQGLNPIAAPTDHSFYWGKTGWQKMALPNEANLRHTSSAWHEILGMAWGKVRGYF